jgi:protoporphyrinogen oxidase
MSDAPVVIVGAGPAGLACGTALLRRMPGRRVIAVEKEDRPGGLCGGFSREGLEFDYGSHRIHPSTPRPVMDYFGSLPGVELAVRPRNGRILLAGRLVRFPPAPLDLLVKLPLPFAARVISDQFRRRRGGTPSDFREAVELRLGRTMAREFYVPYAAKLWGLQAGDISPRQAERRISLSGGSLIRKVLAGLPLLGGLDRSRFFRYPVGGFRSLADGMAAGFTALGGEIRAGSAVRTVRLCGDGSLVVEAGEDVIRASRVFWSAPARELGTAVADAPDAVREACSSLRSRGLVLVYMVLPGRCYTGYDAHYFPGAGLPVSRLSEPRNYSRAGLPPDRTGLCIELPCEVGGREWSMTDEEAAAFVISCLAESPLPELRPLCSWTVRLASAYPVYVRGFEEKTAAVSDWLRTVPGLVTMGRQGLFAHDNVHHAVETGIGAASCLTSDGWDGARWDTLLAGFESHCVSD